ncbi:MAG: bifunctional 4-hydroxy-2-oxoglutarate aldolase/2-dehydro-3-deoxy-phosphogluconate aldolase [Planctomycetota bacterium]|jgi:2-keto-3-deoxy-6-phosphogluconate aldolase
MSGSRRAEVLAEILRRRVSAIIRTNDQELAAEAMRAAVGGGFRVVEFTLTTPGALELIAEFAAEADLLVGAGTVMSPTQAREARAAGAKFLVSPVCDPQVIAAARALDVVSIPGTFTPTEMLTAHRCGADMVKLFPGPAFPTAGVTLGNFLDILKAGAAGVGFVKPLFEPADLAKRDFAAIEQRAASVIARLAGLSSPAPGSN